MSTDKNRPSFDEIVNGIRGERADDDTVAAAADRVRARLGLGIDGASGAAEPAVRFESCDDFRAAIPAFVAGTLRPALAALLDEHTRECVPCRRALLEARSPRLVPADTPRPGAATRRRWTAAAAVIAALALTGAVLNAFHVFSPAPRDLKVVSLEGSLYTVSGASTAPLSAGMAFPENRPVRTAKGSTAIVAMVDGSRIEMAERTELTVDRRRDGATIRLGQGRIIVQASKQGSGHLDVRTDDCLVSVKGTIFSVNSGTKGSRISVIEGAVAVSHGGSDRLLHPGEQMATSPALDAVPVGEEIAWSHDLDTYLARLRELESLRDEMNRNVREPAVRRASALLDRVPAGTVFYAAIPNLSEALGQASKIIRDRIATSPVFRDWWDEAMRSPEARSAFDNGLAKLQALGDQLGDEIVVTFPMTASGRVGAPTFLAQAKDPEAFRRFIAQEVPEASQGLALDVDGRFVTARAKNHASPAAATAAPFSGTPFHARLAEAYAKGAGWIVAADLHTILAAAPRRPDLDRTGLLDADLFVFERAPDGARARQTATLDFAGPRRGVVGWLSAPGPMGSLDYVSPEASVAVAFLAKDPADVLREMIDAAGGTGGHLASEIASFRDRTGVDLLADVAEPLGGDAAVALDGPFLPTPAWKVALEVDDPARLQQALEKLVRSVAEQARNQGGVDGVSLRSESAGGRVIYTLSSSRGPGEVDYTYDGGYLVAAPSPALLERMLEQKANGYSLATSAGFRNLLPRDGHANASAIVYENLGPALGPLTELAQGALTPDQRQTLQEIAQGSKPVLACAYASDRQIVFASDDPNGLGGGLLSWMQLGELSRLRNALQRKAGQPSP